MKLRMQCRSTVMLLVMLSVMLSVMYSCRLVGCLFVLKALLWDFGCSRCCWFSIEVLFCVWWKMQDERLLTSVRLSERILLWNRFSGPIDPHSVKVDFLRKIHRTNPPFRVKCRPVLRHRPLKVFVYRAVFLLSSCRQCYKQCWVVADTRQVHRLVDLFFVLFCVMSVSRGFYVFFGVICCLCCVEFWAVIWELRFMAERDLLCTACLWDDGGWLLCV